MKRRTMMIALLSLPALAYLVVPLIGLFAKTALDQVCPLLRCPPVKWALMVTGITSGVAAVVIVLIGTPLAYLLAHTEFRGKRIVDTVVDIPLVLPPAVAGVALYFTFGRTGMIGRHFSDTFTIPFTMLAVVMAQVFVSAPLYIRQARVGFLSVPPQVVAASRTLGASHLRTWMKVTLPLASHGIIAGLVLAWARSIGELGATYIFAGNMQGVTQTMSLAIFQKFEGQTDLTAVVVMSAILMVISFAVIIITKWVLEADRRHEASAMTVS